MKSLLGGSLLVSGVGLGISKAIFFPESFNSEHFLKTSNKEDQIKKEGEQEGVASNPSEVENKSGTGDSTGDTSGSNTVEGQHTTQSPTEGTAQSTVAPKSEEKCTIYKILNSSNKTASAAEDGFLDREIKKQPQTYKEIQNDCTKGKKIYVSWEKVNWFWPSKYEWVYRQSQQNIDWKIIK
nr:hypothetical protein [Mycoplasma haemocanis]